VVLPLVLILVALLTLFVVMVASFAMMERRRRIRVRPPASTARPANRWSEPSCRCAPAMTRRSR
jgi:hypothetical protein